MSDSASLSRTHWKKRIGMTMAFMTGSFELQGNWRLPPIETRSCVTDCS